MKRIAPGVIALALLAGCVGTFAADNPGGTAALEATIYQIRNVKFQELLRPKDAGNATGTPIVLYPAQPWKCMTWQLQSVGEPGFCLKNLFTSKTFSANAGTNVSLTPVTQAPLAKAVEPPAWQFTKLGDGSYKISDSKSGKVLTAVKSSKQSEARIVVSQWQNLDEQKWIMEKMDPSQLTM